MLGSSGSPGRVPSGRERGRGNRPFRTRPFRTRRFGNEAFARLTLTAGRLSDGLDRVATSVAALLLLVMVAAVAAQVFFRFVLQNSLSWSEELSRYCFVWLSLLGASTALKRGMHPALGGLSRVLPDRFRPLTSVLCNLAAVCVVSVLFREGLGLARLNMRQTSPAMGIPMGIPYGAIPVASGLMLVHLVSSLARSAAPVTAECDGDGLEPGADTPSDRAGAEPGADARGTAGGTSTLGTRSTSGAPSETKKAQAPAGRTRRGDDTE